MLGRIWDDDVELRDGVGRDNTRYSEKMGMKYFLKTQAF